jgi:hypothetical protein
MVTKLKLRGPLEKSIQAWILASLGVQARRFVVSPKTGKGKWVGTGIFVAREGSYFWRANSGQKPYLGQTRDGEPFRGLFKGAPKGTADILGVVCGVSVALEVKREGERQDEAQREWQAIHEAAGGVYAVVRSPGEAQAVVARVKRLAALPFEA